MIVQWLKKFNDSIIGYDSGLRMCGRGTPVLLLFNDTFYILERGNSINISNLIR